MTKRGGWESTGFGPRLKELREERGLSQKVLAEKTECNPATVAKIENGLQEPAWPLVLRFCVALEVTPDTFLTPAEPRAPKGPGRPRKEPPAKPRQPKKRGRPTKTKE